VNATAQRQVIVSTNTDGEKSGGDQGNEADDGGEVEQSKCPVR
jgi:hypothetical protein